MMKKYKFGFDIWGLILFFIVMIPNFIWFAVPAPNDVLRAESTTQTIDMIASICQVILVAALCLIISKEHRKIKLSPTIKVVIICVLIYFAGWILYYCGNVSAPVILLLTIPPCLSFVFYAVDRKNTIALVPAIVFSCCHLIYGVVNFIV